MDVLDSLYGFFGTSDVRVLGVDLLVSVVLAVAITYLVLEIVRIFSDHSIREPVVQDKKPIVAPHQDIKPKEGAVSPAKPAEAVKAPVIDVLKGTLNESMNAMVEKYRLDSLTLASRDGLVIASTSKTPDEDAAVYSNMFQDLNKKTPNTYFYVDSKSIHLYSVDIANSSIIGVIRKPGTMSQDIVMAMKEDSRRIADKFTTGSKKA